MKTVGKVLGALAVLFVLFVLWGYKISTPASDAYHDAKYAVESALKDGSSAEYRDVKVFTITEGFSVCGQVNAKNGFGAMAGFTRFLYQTGGSALVEDSQNTRDFEVAWASNGCYGSYPEYKVD